jgi:NAD(P)-dependent dehydrogenase (short-subunit alcohol dehydrogenase family)
MQRRVDTVEIEGDEWDRVIAVNLCGVWSCVKTELRQMLRNGGGAIVNCSSLGSIVGNPGVDNWTGGLRQPHLIRCRIPCHYAGRAAA